MSGTVTTLVQLGFTVGFGLLIDTFVERTMVVPAFAAIVGPKLWWPSKVEPAAAYPTGRTSSTASTALAAPRPRDESRRSSQ
jgi:uncharacterized membrane protein YdfJ with MMPL/SSD domain